MKKSATLTLAAALVLGLSRAEAADHKVGQKHARKANELAAAGKCKQAMPEYDVAYRLLRDPALLFNRAECLRKLGKNDQARYDYRKFLEGMPAAPNRASVEARIAALDPTFVPSPRPLAEVPPPAPVPPEVAVKAAPAVVVGPAAVAAPEVAPVVAVKAAPEVAPAVAVKASPAVAPAVAVKAAPVVVAPATPVAATSATPVVAAPATSDAPAANADAPMLVAASEAVVETRPALRVAALHVPVKPAPPAPAPAAPGVVVSAPAPASPQAAPDRSWLWMSVALGVVAAAAGGTLFLNSRSHNR